MTAVTSAPPSLVGGAECHPPQIHAFRCTGTEHLRHDARRILTAAFGEASRQAGGRYYYRCGLLWGNGSGIYWDASSSSNRGMCTVELSGGLLDLIHPEDRVRIVQALAELGFRATRLDIALDFVNPGPEFIDRIEASLRADHLRHLRRWKNDDEYADGVLVQRMVRMGRRGSLGGGRSVRVYDKGLESKSKPLGEWVRWETEFAGDCAQNAMLEVLGKPGDRHLAEVTLGAVDFRHGDNAHLDRCRRVDWWATLLATLDPLRVVAKRIGSTVDSWRAWMDRCVLPALATFARAKNTTIEAVARWINAAPQIKPDLLGSDKGRAFMAIWKGGDEYQQSLALAALLGGRVALTGDPPE